MEKYLGIIGDPVQHTLSPVMHVAAIKAQGLDYTYLPFRVRAEDLRAALDGLRVLGFSGFNVTIPHKVAIVAYLDQVSPEARLIGAVNTVCLEAGSWVGYNTDGTGFLRSLEEDGGISVTGRRVLLLGAGGAARAVAVQMALTGVAEVVIANRTLERANALAAELTAKIPGVSYQAIAWTDLTALAEAVGRAEILINATPIGMEGYMEQEFPVKADWYHSGQVAVDLIYRPRLTPFLRQAASAGLPILSGEGMLLYQGAEAFSLWTGMEPPVEVMREALLNTLEGKCTLADQT